MVNGIEPGLKTWFILFSIEICINFQEEISFFIQINNDIANLFRHFLQKVNFFFVFPCRILKVACIKRGNGGIAGIKLLGKKPEVSFFCILCFNGRKPTQ